jgi:2-oxoglutarate ferredoxin oxidoreductase subunit alpha
MAFEAVRIAIEHMTPVILLSDSFLANSSAPWRIPEESELPGIKVAWGDLTPEEFQPYMRDPETLVRPWVTPGTPGLEHRIGGLEKQENTGKVTYDADNHRRMVELRAEKIARIADNIPRQEVKGPRQGELLVVGWGSTHGPVAGAVEELRHQGMSVAHAHLRYLNPFPRNLEEVLRRYDRVVAVENNGGQLASILRDRFLIDVQRLNKIEGRPFLIREVVEGLNRYVETTA